MTSATQTDQTETPDFEDRLIAFIEWVPLRVFVPASVVTVIGLFIAFMLTPFAIPDVLVSKALADWTQSSAVGYEVSLFWFIPALLGIVGFGMVEARLDYERRAGTKAVAVLVSALAVFGACAYLGAAQDVGDGRIIERAEAKYDVDIETNGKRHGADGGWQVNGQYQPCDSDAFYADISDPVLRCSGPVGGWREVPVGG